MDRIDRNSARASGNRRAAGTHFAFLLLFALAWASSLSAQSFPATGTGPIPDATVAGPRNYGAPLDLRFNVTGLAGTVSNARIAFNASHTFVGDLRVTLIAPTGISHLLFETTGATDGSGGSPANLVSVATYTFDDAAATNWWTAAGLANVDIPSTTARTVVSGGPGVANPPPVTSINESLGGAPPNGEWILRFEDGWVGDAGTVTAANLTLTVAGTTRTVTKVADTNDGVCDADCSLREAIAMAVAGDRIEFAPMFNTPRAIILGGTQLTIDKSLAIVGPGAHLLTISGNDQSRIFAVNASGPGRPDVTLSGMRLSDGNGTGSAPQGFGGAIATRAHDLVVHACDISGNRVSDNGGGIAVENGAVPSRARLVQSSVSNNVALGSGASKVGGIFIFGSEVELSRVTVSGNHAPNGGTQSAGGVLPRTSVLTLVDSTVVGNHAAASNPGGVYSRDSTTRIRNTVVAGNRGSPSDIDSSGGSVVSLGYNLIGNPGAIGAFNQPGDQVGIVGVPLDPRLGPLSHNGGTTPVHAPLRGSPLLDKGSAIGVDQRGVPRPVDFANIAPATGGNNADIGAVEMNPQVVLNTDDSGAGSLRQALADAPVVPAVSDIWFAAALTVAPATITLTSGQLAIDRNLAIHGPGAPRLTISGNRQSRVVGVQASRRVALTGLTLTDGNGVGTPDSEEGGAVLNATGSHLTLADSVVQNSDATFGGGGIRNRDRAALVLRGTTVRGNTSSAAVDSGDQSVLTIEASTISGNRDEFFGGIYLFSGYMTLENSTVTANHGQQVGGIVGDVRMRNSIVAGNTSAGTHTDLGFSSGVVSRGHNLVGNVGAVTTLTAPGDQTGTFAAPLDARLGPLMNNGGGVPTHALLGGSPALDKGLRYGLDQRGLAGAFDITTIAAATGGNHADIGATEMQAIFVDNNLDSGAASLRQAVIDANGNGPGTDDVLFAPTLNGTITIGTALPNIAGNLNLHGPGADVLIIRRNDAALPFGLLNAFTPGTQLGVSGLSLANGRDDGSNGGDTFGGAIDAFGADLYLAQVDISSNFSATGGGVSLVGNGEISGSTIRGNVGGFQAGGIYFQGTNNRLVVSNSTISGNTANDAGAGGGINNAGSGAPGSRSILEVSSSTITANTGVNGAGIRTGSADTGVISATTLRNTIIASNNGANLTLVTATGPGSVTSLGYNLSNVAETLLDQPTDRENVAPLLGPLAANGGRTRTHTLLAGSPAIDGGERSGPLSDQRALPRPVDLAPLNAAGGDGSDIGAVELQTNPVDLIFANGFEP